MSSPSEPRDAWANEVARGLVLDLTDRGVEIDIVAGRVLCRPAAALTDADRALIRQHRADLVILVLACDGRTLDRLTAMQAGALVPGVPVRGRCHTCRETHEDGSRIGSCGWCRLAAIQYAHWRMTDAYQRTGTVPASLRLQADAAVLSARLLYLFPASISGHEALFPAVA